MADIVLLDGNGVSSTYTGKETVTIPTPDGGEQVFETQKVREHPTVVLDFSAGDTQEVSPSAGAVLDGVTISKPDGADQLIAKGETVAGIIGEYVTPGTEKEIDPDFSGGDHTVTAEGDERWGSVTIKKPEALVPENIAAGVGIAGITGTLSIQKAPHQLLDGTVSSAFMLVDNMFDTPPTSIKMALSNNTKLWGLNLSQVSAIANYCFQGCTGLLYAALPALKSVPTNAFMNCRMLQNVVINNVSSIAQSAFCNCYTIKTANVPLCTSIGSYAFYNCSSLENVTAKSCKYVGPRAFYGCSKLRRAVFPAASMVGLSAFYACYSLSFAYFSALSAVPTYGFYSCKRLESLYLLGASVIPIYNYAFTYTPMYNSTYISKYGSIFVRESLVDAYKASASWSALASRIVGMTDDEIESLKTELGV